MATEPVKAAEFPEDVEALRILNMPEVCRLIGLSSKTIYKMIARGNFPKPIALTPRGEIVHGRCRVGWKQTTIREWLDNRPAA